MTPAITASLDFQRLAALPRRALDRASAEAMAAHLTPRLRRPGSSAELRPWQAAVLYELATEGGCWAALPVGQGKTLISYLAVVLAQAPVSVLVVPAALRAKTYADFGKLSEDWAPIPGALVVLSREELALESRATTLADAGPRLVVIDEADSLRNAKAAAVRRLHRYIIAHPETRVLALSGTPSNRSLLEYWHLVLWCLRDKAPMPLDFSEAQAWAQALDSRVVGQRLAPGVLGESLKDARAWYRERLVSAPGVVIVDEDSCSMPLTVSFRRGSQCPAIESAFETFATTLESPGGEVVSDSLSRHRIEMQLGLGYYSEWCPPPPDEWRVARRAVCAFVRDRIEETTRAAKPLDTEAQVLRAHESLAVVLDWHRAKPLFGGATTRAVWLSSRTIEDALAWLDESPLPGIIWTSSVPFAEALASASGGARLDINGGPAPRTLGPGVALPYYGRDGKTADGRSLLEADPASSMIVSIDANYKGFNLQAWPRQLLVGVVTSALRLEQALGRSHRAGQTRPVTLDILATSGLTFDAFTALQSDAAAVRESLSLSQKITRASISLASETRPAGYRWAQRDDTDNDNHESS